MKRFLSMLCLVLACLAFILSIGLVGGYETGKTTFGNMVCGLILCGGGMFALTKLCEFLDR